MFDLDVIQQEISVVGSSDMLKDKESKAQFQLQKALNTEEAFLKQMTNLNWFSFGDRNTALFFTKWLK